MHDLQIFNNEKFGTLKTVMINGEPWFVGKDVADMLGYSNSRDAISNHVFGEDKGVAQIDTLGGLQSMTIINESGLYSLVLRDNVNEKHKGVTKVTTSVGGVQDE